MTAFVFHTTNPPDTAGGIYATFKNEVGLMWNPNTNQEVVDSQNRDDFDVQAIQDGPTDNGSYRIPVPSLLPAKKWWICIYKEDSVGNRSWANDDLRDTLERFWNGAELSRQHPDLWGEISFSGSQSSFSMGVGPKIDGALIGYAVRVSSPDAGEDSGLAWSTHTIINHTYAADVHTITLDRDVDFTIAGGESCEFYRPSNADVVLIKGSSDAATNAKKFFTTGYGPLIARATVSAVDEQGVNEVILQLDGLSQAGEPSYNGCTVIIRDDDNPDDVWVGHITGHSIDPELIVIKPQQPIPFNIGVDDIVEILPPGMMLSDRESLETVETTVGSSGGGVLSARIGYSSLTPQEFLEIIQGEEKTITFVVEADGRFDQESADEIRVGFRCPEGNTIIKEDEDVERVCEAFDVQVIRTTLTPNETYELTEGLLRMEIAFDDQKAGLTRAIKIVEGLIGTGT